MRKFFDRLTNAVGWALNGVMVLGLWLAVHEGPNLWQ